MTAAKLEKHFKKDGRVRYSEEMPERVRVLAEDGLFLEEIAAELGVHVSTMWRWCDPDGQYYKPDFADAIILAETRRDARILRTLRLGMQGLIENFSASATIFALKNTVGWTDKVQQDTTVTNAEIVVDLRKPAEVVEEPPAEQSLDV